jgi:hypothetical protein
MINSYLPFQNSKRRWFYTGLKLIVLLLLTLNLYLFTSDTQKFSSVELNETRDIKLVLNQRNIIENNSTTKTSNSTTITTHPSTQMSGVFNECNYLQTLTLDETSSNECDLLITVKTTSPNYGIKLNAILRTWFKLIPAKVTN